MKSFSTFFRVIAILLILSSLTLAQKNGKGSLRGVVVDATTKKPLPFANVVLKGTSRGAATDLNGRFVIKNVDAGEYTIEVSFLGYEKVTEKITVRKGVITKLKFKLKPLTIKGNEVVVTAQAEGQMNAINEQLTANTIKNVVSPAKIQEIPDANAAESVGRLPGVSIKRVGGEGNKVVIRGLSPKYNAITLNGVKLPSTGSGDRSTDISMISPYMLQGIEVIKAITPDQDADALGGTVNFKVKKAPKKFKMDVLARGGYNHLENSYGDYKFVLSVSKRFFNKKLGVFAQGDIESRNRSSDELNASHEIINPSLKVWNKVNAISAKFKKYHRIKKRYGATVVLDYNLRKGSLIFSNFVSKSATDNRVQSEVFSAANNSHTYSVSDNGNDLMLLNNTLNFDYDFNLFKIDAVAANSFSENVTPLNLYYDFLENAAFTNATGLENPFSIVDSAKNDIQNTYFNSLSTTKAYNKASQLTAAANIEIPLNFSDFISAKVKFGAKYRHLYKYNNLDKRKRIFQPYRYAMDSIRAHFPWMNSVDVGSASIENLPYQLFIDANQDARRFLDGQFTFGPHASYDLLHDIYNMLMNTPDNIRKGLNGAPLLWPDWPSSIRDDYYGTENYSAGYAMAEINIGNNLMILPGVRYEDNVTQYTASRGDDARRIEEGYNYHDTTMTRHNYFWLPMVHVKYDPLDWLGFRFAYTNTLTRPNFSRIIPGWHINTTNSFMAYKNYQLKPGESENFDFAVTVYQNHIGFLNAAFFYKKIKNLIYNPGTLVLTYPNEFGIPKNLGVETISTTINNKYTAEIKGVELDWQTHFWYLPFPFDGLVLDVNLTLMSSETKYPKNILRDKIVGYDTTFVFGQPHIIPIRETVNVDTFYTGRIVDQPNQIFNISLGYDYKGFSGRISMQYTDNILSRTNFWPELTAFTDTYVRWDLSLKQKLPVKGLQIYFNMNNITNAVDKSLIAGNKYPTAQQYYDMTMDLGIRYTL